jgi:hypothetical protein
MHTSLPQLPSDPHWVYEDPSGVAEPPFVERPFAGRLVEAPRRAFRRLVPRGA